jgi:Flp pilus assembly protein TadB
MDSNIDFKNIWQQQKVSEPNMAELLHKLKKYKHTGLRKLLLSNLILLATSVIILMIWYQFEPQFLTTKIGIVLVLLAMVIFLFSYNKQLPIYRKIDQTKSNQDYLSSLKMLKQKQKHLQTSIMSLYFIMLFVGICLYMYEYALRMSATGAIITYAVTIVWIAFNWFYIRPKTIKKQQLQLDEIISRFERITADL